MPINTILLVEDEDDLRTEISSMLSFEGYNIIEANDGSEGVKSALKNQPDLIVCDIGLPIKDGFDVLEELSHHPSTKFIPFIFLTAKSERDNRRRGMSLGADDYITKPFTKIELLDSIATRKKKFDELKLSLESNVDNPSLALNTPTTQNKINSEILRLFPHKYTKDSFLLRFNKSYPKFFNKLLKKHPNLSHQDLLLSSSIVLNLSGKYQSTILDIELDSTYKKKHNLKRKLNLMKDEDINAYLRTFL